MDISQQEYIESSFYIENTKRNDPNFVMANPHIHNCYEIYYLVEGRRDYFIHDGIYRVDAGSLVLIPPHIIHRTLTSGDDYHHRYLIYASFQYLEKVFNVLEDMDWYRSFDKEHPIIQLDIHRQKQFLHLLKKLETAHKDTTIFGKNATKVYFMELLLELISLRKESINNPRLLIVNNEMKNKRIYDVVQYLNKHYSSSCGLEDLAKQFYISPYHLSRSFKNVTGFGLKEYVSQVRILEAEKLLLNTNLSIMAISQQVGYDSSTHFGRVFKKLKNMTANQYRRRFQ